jgi:broad specificity phosphatase PhoE
MRRRTALAIGAFLLLLLPAFANAQRAAFIVRHAEKAIDSNEPSVPLSPAGAERARRLASMLKDAGIAAIYSTDFVRTRATVEPLAEILKLPIQIYAPKDAQGKPTAAPLLDQITRRNKNDVVLVVGHSDTVPVLIESLKIAQRVEIAAGEYDNLFLVLPGAAGGPLLLRLRY